MMVSALGLAAAPGWELRPGCFGPRLSGERIGSSFFPGGFWGPGRGRRLARLGCGLWLQESDGLPAAPTPSGMGKEGLVNPVGKPADP